MLPNRSVAAEVALGLVLVACSLPAPSAAPSMTPTRMPTAVTGTPVPSPTAPPTPSTNPSSEPRDLDADELRAAVDRATIERHLVTLAGITERHGGHRLTGSDGFEAAHAYATDVLKAAGLTVEAHSFAVDGMTVANLVAERAGTSDRVVMLGAHLDTVAGSPGMNDNASGVAAVLAIGEALAGLPAPHHTIRLALWDAEEGGPFGSRAYVESLADTETDAIVAYLNLDMIGSPNAIRLIYDEADAAPGSERITRLFAAHFDAAGLAWEPIDLEGASDHGPFTEAAIPTGGLFSGGIEPVTEAQAGRFGAMAGIPADACSHRPCDTLDNVDPTTTTELARVVASVLAELAARPQLSDARRSGRAVSR